MKGEGGRDKTDYRACYERVNNFVSIELMRINRETSAIKQAGFQQFRLTGPLDKKTCKVCARQIGFIRTKSEWLNRYPNIFSYGLHFGCRHKLMPIKKSFLKTDEEKAAFDNKSRLLYSKSDKKIIEKALK